MGCPTDLGMYAGGRSAAGGPRALRQASQIYPVSASGPWPGWHEYATGKTLMAGMTVQDAGDLSVDSLDPQKALDLLPDVIRTLKTHCRLVVLLGGDHSLTYWTAQAFEEGGHSMLMLDAHEDATALGGAMPHAGNFIRYLDQTRRQAVIVQHGLRGLVPADQVAPPPNRVFARQAEEIEVHLARGNARELIVSMDVDVLDPMLLRAVASPSPGGLSPSDVVLAMAAAAASGLSTRLLEIMEFAPETREDPLQAFLLVQLIIRAMHELLATP